MPSSPLVLVTGPTRSGKSEWAESLAMTSQRTVTYVATAQRNPADPDWEARIERHKQRRPEAWRVWECSGCLTPILRDAQVTDCLLIDSLGTWLVNYLESPADAWSATSVNLLTHLETTAAQVILVTEETGWGIVPAYPSGRLFRDRLGTLTRQVAALCSQFYLVVGGYAVDLKQVGTLVPPMPWQANLTPQ
ncbi:MAG: bifunctional adenosylcobinamide kinase/adenosylcobinamide-phosphate guanylyltransferase [Cyanobacteria bacterium P01_H01_bin.121]